MLKHEFTDAMQMADLSKSLEARDLLGEVQRSLGVLTEITERWEQGRSWDDLIVECVNMDGEHIRVLVDDPDLCEYCRTFGGHQSDCVIQIKGSK